MEICPACLILELTILQTSPPVVLLYHLKTSLLGKMLLLLSLFFMCTRPFAVIKEKTLPKFSEGSGEEYQRENTIHFDHNICAVVLLFLVMSWEQPNTFSESF